MLSVGASGMADYNEKIEHAVSCVSSGTILRFILHHGSLS